MTFITIITTSILFSLALVHIYWGFGGLWPGNTKQELIDKVFGKGNQFPSPFICFFVALGLFLFSMLPILWMFRFSLIKRIIPTQMNICWMNFLRKYTNE
ncbi:DUF3995 domain-containing protein [Leptospira bouyouniensis]|uniref:DUF3995 domain-containing protein n=1 Tax=Leptospira bouyouniensis TaxID=2484911 RepID=A0A7I0IHD4_9LEPT|nr:DUF3995 domain-containing protein [Leptospira bouyouniensis]TGL01186.1 DUF3995 domain-containing protein [Leptospira bouyouniensis]